MRPYRDLVEQRRARWPLISSGISRLTPGMIVFAILLLLRDVGHTYASAGVVMAAHQIGVGVGSPIQGRLADRLGQARLLVPDAFLYLAGTVALASAALLGAGTPALVAVAAMTGMVLPPVTACSRVLLSRLFPGGQLRETAFAVSSITVEIGFIVGPLAAGGVAVVLGPAWAVILAGAASTVGALGYALTEAAREIPPRGAGNRAKGALASRAVRIVVLSVGAKTVIFGVLDVVVPAVAELRGGLPSAGSWLLAAISVGGITGGVVYGARSWPGTVAQRLRGLLWCFSAGLFLLPFASVHLWWFAATLTMAGIFLAPTTITAFHLLDDLAASGTQTEAQSWLQSSVVAGMALGAAVSGGLVDAFGTTAALVFGAGSVAFSGALIHVGRASLATSGRPSPP